MKPQTLQKPHSHYSLVGMLLMQPLILNKAKPVIPKAGKALNNLKDWGLTSMNASTAYAPRL